MAKLEMEAQVNDNTNPLRIGDSKGLADKIMRIGQSHITNVKGELWGQDVERCSALITADAHSLVAAAEEGMRSRCIDEVNAALADWGEAIVEAIRSIPLSGRDALARHDERVRLEARIEEAKWWAAYHGKDYNCDGAKRIAELESQLAALADKGGVE
jgi:hypothetical protein